MLRTYLPCSWLSLSQNPSFQPPLLFYTSTLKTCPWHVADSFWAGVRRTPKNFYPKLRTAAFEGKVTVAHNHQSKDNRHNDTLPGALLWAVSTFSWSLFTFLFGCLGSRRASAPGKHANRQAQVQIYVDIKCAMCCMSWMENSRS